MSHGCDLSVHQASSVSLLRAFATRSALSAMMNNKSAVLLRSSYGEVLVSLGHCTNCVNC